MWRWRLWRTPVIAMAFYFAFLVLAGGVLHSARLTYLNGGRTFFVVTMAVAILAWSAAFYAVRRSNRLLYGSIELLLTVCLGAVFFTTNVAQRELPDEPLSDFLAWVQSGQASLTFAAAVYVGVRALDNIGEGLKPDTCLRATWDSIFPKA